MKITYSWRIAITDGMGLLSTWQGTSTVTGGESEEEIGRGIFEHTLDANPRLKTHPYTLQYRVRLTRIGSEGR
jgi:hypothetical protein